MKGKLNALTLTLLLGFTTSAVSDEPISVPKKYNNGPASFAGSSMGFNSSERAAYSLYDSAMQIFQGLIQATSCTSVSGSYSFNVSANGDAGTPASNEIKFLTKDGEELLVIQAIPHNPIAYRGQDIHIEQVRNASIKGSEIKGFSGTVTFNNSDTIMVSQSSVQVKGDNGAFVDYQLNMIKDYNLGEDTNDHHIYDWGLESLSVLDFPEEKHWQRSKSLRDNGTVKRTVFVKDRTVGSSSCRIIIDGSRSNKLINGASSINQKIFSQSGTLTISTEKPNDPIPAFDAF